MVQTDAPPKNEPFSKSSHASFQISASFELRIRHRLDRNFGEGMADQGADVLWECAERVIAALMPDLVL